MFSTLGRCAATFARRALLHSRRPSLVTRQWGKTHCEVGHGNHNDHGTILTTCHAFFSSSSPSALSASLLTAEPSAETGNRRAIAGEVPGSKYRYSPLNFRATYPMPEQRPPFVWEAPPRGRNPARHNNGAAALLLTNNEYIDKSAALHRLLKPLFSDGDGDFMLAPHVIVYPSRLGKTTLLEFIEATFCPLPRLDGRDMDAVKLKIASLERGPELLAFGLHPVVRLNMSTITRLSGLHKQITRGLARAGLRGGVRSIYPEVTPSEHLRIGIEQLNALFKAETGKDTRTIVLVDEFDQPHRDWFDEVFHPELDRVYGLAKEPKAGISLFMIGGETRMVAADPSQLNNLVDVSRLTEHHGLCGIVADELVRTAAGQLDVYARDRHGGRSFDEVLLGRVGEDGERGDDGMNRGWSSFRFGLNIDSTPGAPDPDSPERSLFSPNDVWELVCGLVTGDARPPSSAWCVTMRCDFEFESFSRWLRIDRTVCCKPKIREFAGYLDGGWFDRTDLERPMTREEYLSVINGLRVKKMLFELGLLAVKRIDAKTGRVLLGSPNPDVTFHGMRLLARGWVPAGQHGYILDKEANEYMSVDGLQAIADIATMKVVDRFKNTGRTEVREYMLYDAMSFEVFIRFPACEAHNRQYTVKSEVHVDRHLVVKILPGPQRCCKIATKLARIDRSDPASIEAEHKRNVDAAKEQFVAHRAIGVPIWAPEETYVVSTVWHPSGFGGEFTAQTRVERVTVLIRRYLVATRVGGRS